eukprot:TRINITY_DN34069_c0_g2_i1.p1 TRINITY_DN34069_c0_g2~~TRINITY_DN34069_c0_g2_i1.p1  ORF type:complete len:311 (-),score=44.90 TRINITY_DN34069_c0_g2_i1:1331-2263(-)
MLFSRPSDGGLQAEASELADSHAARLAFSLDEAGINAVDANIRQRRIRGLLLVHAALAARWAVVPLLVLYVIKLPGWHGFPVAFHMGGNFCGWSLVVLAVDSGVVHRGRIVQLVSSMLEVWAGKRGFLCCSSILQRLPVPAAAVGAVVAIAMLIVSRISSNLGFPFFLPVHCATVGGGVAVFASLLARRAGDVVWLWLYFLWVFLECILEVAASFGVIYTFGFFLTSGSEPAAAIREEWQWLWRLLWVNCGLSCISVVVQCLAYLQVCDCCHCRQKSAHRMDNRLMSLAKRMSSGMMSPRWLRNLRLASS